MNKTVIIVGGGYSLKEGIEKGLWKKLVGKDVWSLNFAYLTMPYLPTREIWVDRNVFKDHAADFQRMHKDGVMMIAKANTCYNAIPEVKTYPTTRKVSEINDPKKRFIGSMGLCGVFGMSIALSESYDKVYLLGYDFGTKDKKDTKTHYYQDKLKVKSTGVGNPTVYWRGNQFHGSLDEYSLFLNKPTKYYNVSLVSNIHHFPKLGWDELFKQMEEL